MLKTVGATDSELWAFDNVIRAVDAFVKATPCRVDFAEDVLVELAVLGGLGQCIECKEIDFQHEGDIGNLCRECYQYEVEEELKLSGRPCDEDGKN